MSDDDTGSWFETSSNLDDGDVPQPERRLEAVPETPEASGDPDWFEQGQASAAPEPERAEHVPVASHAVGPKALFAGSVAVVLLVLGGGAWFLASLLGGQESSSAPLTVPTTEVSAEPADSESAAAGEACEASESAKVITGDGKGDQDSVAGVVLAFQYAYYVERDAEKIEPLVDKDSNIRDLDALQAGIDSVERGTTHCVSVTPEDDKVASVEITETSADGTMALIEQRVTTTSESGDVRIVSIESVDEGSK